MRLYIFVDSSNCCSFTFLAIKSLIFVAQKAITYHWKGNRITNVLSTINDRYFDDSNIKKWQKLNSSNCYSFTFLAIKSLIFRTESYNLSLERKSNNQCTQHNQWSLFWRFEHQKWKKRNFWKIWCQWYFWQAGISNCWH